ncbi:MAG TPA: hypothetical protein PLR99_25300, partial [Polyangiaceae bacterium]|nr:hypothetical protein [Polyangiaceae bacterium]
MDGEGDARAPEGSVAAEALPAREPASDAGAEGSAESSAPEAAGLRATPVEPFMPSVQIQADALEQL